jgi:prepilin-type N-terminal cleavage/methylation domain-containing protein
MKKQLYGFTLFELLVVIAALSILLGLSVASYTRFNKKERVRQAALTFKSDLRYAQSRAVSGEKPTTANTCAPNTSPCCTTYEGIVVTYGSSSYSMQHSCTPQGVVGSLATTTFPAGTNISFVSGASVLFRALNKTTNAALLNVDITNGTWTYRIVIYPSGDIGDVGFL